MDLVVFDIDGTLIRYHRKRNDAAYVRAVEEVLGIKVEDSWAGFSASTDSGILEELVRSRLGRSCAPEEADAVRRSLGLHLPREYGAEPFEAAPGAREVWGALKKDSRTRVAVATGNFALSARFKLGSAGLDPSGVPLASADDGVERAELLRIAAERAGGADGFRRRIYVGDWVWDIRAAKALGWDFIGIGDAEGAAVLRREGASTVLPDFRDFLAVLEGP